MIKYRGITAQIVACNGGYECTAADRLNNSVTWRLHAQTMPDAITRAESHLDSAIHYLRGFIVLSNFLERVEEN